MSDSSSRTTDMLAAALEYAHQGVPVIPLCWPLDAGTPQVRCGYHKKQCNAIGKRPLINDWTHAASFDDVQVRMWWTQWPLANIGMPTGVTSGRAVIDIDDKAAGLKWAEEHGGPWNDTALVATGRGYQYHFEIDQPIASEDSRLPAGLEIKAEGRQVVMPPSLHHNGKRYRWVRSPDEAILPLPENLVALFGEKREFTAPTPAQTEGNGHGKPTEHHTEPGEWQDAYVEAAIEDYTGRIASAGEGDRHAQLVKACQRLAGYVKGNYLDPEWALIRIRSACKIANKHGTRQITDREITDAWTSAVAKAVVIIPGIGKQARSDDAEQQRYIEQERMRRAARRAVDEEEAVSRFVLPPSRLDFAEDLKWLEEQPPDEYAIDKLAMVNHNVLVIARYKEGKSTIGVNLAKAWADGEKFLGQFEVFPEGRFAVINFEMSEREQLSMLRDIRVRNHAGISTWNLHGYSFPIWTPVGEDAMVDWLIERNAHAAWFDPWGKLFAGAGNSHLDDDIIRVTDAIDRVARRASLKVLFIATHTPRANMEEGEERSQGGQRLDAWASARWVYVKGKKGDQSRYLTVNGRRGVGLEESRLIFNPITQELTLSEDDIGHSRRQGELDARVIDVLQHIKAHPGATSEEVIDKKAGGLGGNRPLTTKAKKVCEDQKLIRIEDDPEDKRIKRHHITDAGEDYLSVPTGGWDIED